ARQFIRDSLSAGFPALLSLADLDFDPVLVHRDHCAVVEPLFPIRPSAAINVHVEESEQRPPAEEIAQILHRAPADERIFVRQRISQRDLLLANRDGFAALAVAVAIVLGEPLNQPVGKVEMKIGLNEPAHFAARLFALPVAEIDETTAIAMEEP